jgi:hypothetical protein
MSKVIELTDKLLAVVVDADSKNHYVSNTNFLIGYEPNGYRKTYTDVPLRGNLEILGTVTKSEISFDAHPYVDIFLQDGIYVCYTDKDCCYLDKNISFYSLLESKGILFENPFGEKCISEYNQVFIERWQEAQSKVVEKVVILKRIE